MQVLLNVVIRIDSYCQLANIKLKSDWKQLNIKSEAYDLEASKFFGIKYMAIVHTCPSFRIWEVVGYLSKEKVNFTLQNLTICVPWPDQMLYFLRLGITNLSLKAWFQLSQKYFETIKTMIYKYYSDYHVRLTQSNSTLFNGANVIDPIVWSMWYSGCLEFFFFDTKRTILTICRIIRKPGFIRTLVID